MPEHNSETLGQYIGKAMERDARTRDQIAFTVGVEGSYLSKLKAGQAPPSATVLEALVRALHLDPQKTRQLAAAAEAKRTIDKMRRQLTHSQEYLRRHAPEALQQTLAESVEGFSSLSSALPMLGAVYQSFLQQIPAAASPGEAVLVLDTQQGTVANVRDVRLQVIRGPELNEHGEVVFQLHIPDIDELPEEFVLEVVFLFVVPAPESVYAIQIGLQERARLSAVPGLEVRVPLPGATEVERLKQGLSRLLRRQGATRLPVGVQGAFTFRIRC